MFEVSKRSDNMAISHREHYLKLKFENHSLYVSSWPLQFYKSALFSKNLLKNFGGNGYKNAVTVKEVTSEWD